METINENDCKQSKGWARRIMTYILCFICVGIMEGLFVVGLAHVDAKVIEGTGIECLSKLKVRCDRIYNQEAIQLNNNLNN